MELFAKIVNSSGLSPWGCHWQADFQKLFPLTLSPASEEWHGIRETWEEHSMGVLVLEHGMGGRLWCIMVWRTFFFKVNVMWEMIRGVWYAMMTLCVHQCLKNTWNLAWLRMLSRGTVYCDRGICGYLKGQHSKGFQRSSNLNITPLLLL